MASIFIICRPATSTPTDSVESQDKAITAPLVSNSSQGQSSTTDSGLEIIVSLHLDANNVITSEPDDERSELLPLTVGADVEEQRTRELEVDRSVEAKSSTTIDKVNSDNFRLIQVLGDGRCFFRCVAVHGITELQNAQRNKNDIATNPKVALLEKDYADRVREKVVACLKGNESPLQSMSGDLRLLLEDTVGARFESVGKRIRAISKPSGERFLVLIFAF